MYFVSMFLSKHFPGVFDLLVRSLIEFFKVTNDSSIDLYLLSALLLLDLLFKRDLLFILFKVLFGDDRPGRRSYRRPWFVLTVLVHDC